MTRRGAWALYNRHCGHVFGIGWTREAVQRQHAAAQMTGKKVAHGLRIRPANASADLEAVQLGTRCAVCSFDTPPASR